MEKNTKDSEFEDFINSAKRIKNKNTEYLVGYYCCGLTAIKKYDYWDARDRNITKGDEIKEYDPADIFSAKKIEQIENDLEK